LCNCHIHFNKDMLIFSLQAHNNIQLPLGVKAMKKSAIIVLSLAAMAACSIGSGAADAAPAPAPAPIAAGGPWTLKVTGTGSTESAAQTNCVNQLEEYYNEDVEDGVIACPVGSSPLAGTPNCNSNCDQTITGNWACPGTVTVTCEPYY
jgi:hypothetical protein